MKKRWNARVLYRREPFDPTLQSYKLYMCCSVDACPVRRQALELLHDAGIAVGWPKHERIGECYSLEQIEKLARGQAHRVSVDAKQHQREQVPGKEACPPREQGQQNAVQTAEESVEIRSLVTPRR